MCVYICIANEFVNFVRPCDCRGSHCTGMLCMSIYVYVVNMCTYLYVCIYVCVYICIANNFVNFVRPCDCRGSHCTGMLCMSIYVYTYML